MNRLPTGARAAPGGVARYARLVSIFTGAIVAVQLEYRANFAVNVVSSLLAAAGGLFGLLLVFGEDESFGG